MSGTTPSLSRRLSGFVAETGISDLSTETSDGAKRVLLDGIGCMLGGSSTDSARMVTDTARFCGGEQQSTIIPWGPKTSLTQAAWANASMLHALELDDYHAEGTVHPGCVVIPSALATAEYLHAGGKDLLLAIVLGYEVAIRLGEAFLGKSFDQGFQPTGTCGVFGAAAAAGKLLGLDAENLSHALGIAGSHASGLREARSTGSLAKRIQPAHAAMCGILSALLASRGFTGPNTILEGENGFLRAYSHRDQYDESRVLQGLGGSWKIRETSFKLHSCCRFAAPVADSAIALRNAHAIRAEDIESIHVETSRTAMDALTRPADRKIAPKTLVDAQFSLPFVVSMAFSRGSFFVDDLLEENLKDERVLALARRVTWDEDEEATESFPKYLRARVSVKTRKGQFIAGSLEKVPKGDPENPMMEYDLMTKFRKLAKMAGLEGRSEALSRQIMDMGACEDVEAFMSGLTGGKSSES